MRGERLHDVRASSSSSSVVVVALALVKVVVLVVVVPFDIRVFTAATTVADCHSNNIEDGTP